MTLTYLNQRNNSFEIDKIIQAETLKSVCSLVNNIASYVLCLFLFDDMCFLFQIVTEASS